MESAEFTVLAETDDLLVVDKPAGLLVHPTKPDGPRTLWDGLRELLGYEIVNGGQVSLINRLDRETSGIVLVAKNSMAARKAAMTMEHGRITKSYLAIVHGRPCATEFEVDAPIIRLGEVAESPVWLQRAVHPGGAAARTCFRTLSVHRSPAGVVSLVEARPITGRTHQIRVHLSHAGFPILGDKIYGVAPGAYLEFIETGWTGRLAARLHFRRQALHSAGLAMVWDDERFDWKSPLPGDMAGFLENAELISQA